MPSNESVGIKPAKPFTVAVFCGSRPGVNQNFTKAAEDLARIFHANGWNLVYGGGTTGIMGSVSSTLVSLSGPESVHGVIPYPLSKTEQSNLKSSTITNAYGHHDFVPDMHTRKRTMAQEANAFIALPGGYGTAEELFEIITWNQLGIHDLPIILLNVDGYWDGIVSWIQGAVDETFVNESCKEIVQVATSVDDIPELIRKYRPPEGRMKLTWGKE